MQSDDAHRSTFHLIARGNCWLKMQTSDERVALRAGDLIVFPRNSPHSIGIGQDDGATDETCIDPDAPTTSLVCGFFDFESPQTNPVLDALPDVIHLRNEDTVKSAMLDTVLRFITAETEAADAGSDVVVDKLSEILFIQVIREYIRKQDIHTGLLAALTDERLTYAIQQVQENPGLAWNVETLATKAGMSRSSFASHFLKVSGMTPMQYVTRWRMQVAFEKLRKKQNSVAQVTEQSGYQSEASFSKAFKQHMGVGPGAVRRSRNRS